MRRPVVVVKGAASLSSAEEQTARAISAYALYAFLLSLQMGSINKTRPPPTALIIKLPPMDSRHVAGVPSIRDVKQQRL